MKLYTTEEVAELLKVDIETVRRFIWKKETCSVQDWQ